MKKIRYAVFLIAAIPFFLKAQSIQQENILYGAAYYHEYGKGTLLYEGSIFSDQIQAKLIKEAVKRAGVAYPHSSGKEQVIAKSVKNGEVLTIAAWDIIIIKKN